MTVVSDTFFKTEMKPALQKRSREKAARMLKAGHVLVESLGYDGMRISDIAKEAGCSVGSFYERFDDKENFFKLMLDSNLSQAVMDIEAYLAPERWENVPTDVIISKFIYQIVRWFRRRKGLYCAALISPSHNNQSFRPFHHHSMKTSHALTRLLEPRHADMSCADIEASVWFSFQMVSGVLAHAALSEVAGGTDADADDDRTIMLDDPELARQLTRSTCAYLGVLMTSNTLKP